MLAAVKFTRNDIESLVISSADRSLNATTRHALRFPIAVAVAVTALIHATTSHRERKAEEVEGKVENERPRKVRKVEENTSGVEGDGRQVQEAISVKARESAVQKWTDRGVCVWRGWGCMSPLKV